MSTTASAGSVLVVPSRVFGGALILVQGACPSPFILSLLFSSLRVRHPSPASPGCDPPNDYSAVHAICRRLASCSSSSLAPLLPCPGRRILFPNTSYSQTDHLSTAYRPIIGTHFFAEIPRHQSMPDQSVTL
jgi:hypothetical protein